MEFNFGQTFVYSRSKFLIFWVKKLITVFFFLLFSFTCTWTDEEIMNSSPSTWIRSSLDRENDCKRIYGTSGLIELYF